jgi:hypothetical protein
VEDALFLALIYFGPFAAGFATGFAFSPRLAGLATSLSCGVLLTAGALLAWVFSTENDQWAACGEDACTTFLGHWAQPGLFRFWLPFTLVTWTAGAFAGWRVRQPSTPAA